MIRHDVMLIAHDKFHLEAFWHLPNYLEKMLTIWGIIFWYDWPKPQQSWPGRFLWNVSYSWHHYGMSPPGPSSSLKQHASTTFVMAVDLSLIKNEDLVCSSSRSAKNQQDLLNIYGICQNTSNTSSNICLDLAAAVAVTAVTAAATAAAAKVLH